MKVNRLICGVVLAVLMIIYQRGDEDRLVHSLEARGYSDIQIERPDQFHCHKSHTFSYRARAPNGTPVHEGACVSFFFFITTEPIAQKKSARG
ncbi:MAG: hypothetical protein ACREC9_10775 [Methylocella sp.]